MLTTIERVLLLQNVELFSSVTSEQLSFLAAIAEELGLESARVLYKEDDPPDGLYVMTPDWLSFSTPGGVEVQFDNSAGLQAGAQVSLFVLGGLDTRVRPVDGEPIHLDTGTWYKVGTGHVSEDGATIVSDPGSGVPGLGWVGWKAE